VAATCTLGLLSDIHYASAAEQARGDDYEYRGLKNPLLRRLLRLHRHYIWLRAPLRQNHLLDRFLERSGRWTTSWPTATSPATPGARPERRRLLSKRQRVLGTPPRAVRRAGAVHLRRPRAGKNQPRGNAGGMRLASYRRATEELGLKPFWRLDLDRYCLIGITSTLVALPLFAKDMLPEESRSGNASPPSTARKSGPPSPASPPPASPAVLPRPDRPALPLAR